MKIKRLFVSNEKIIYGNEIVLKVRERGTFWLRYIYLEDYSMVELRRKIMDKFGYSKGNLYGAYLLWDRERQILKTDTEVASLKPGKNST